MARELIEINAKDAPRTSAASPGDSPGRIAIPLRTTSERSGGERAATERGRIRQRSADDASTDTPDLEDAIDFDGDEDAQFLRTQRRVPVRRATITRKAASKLKIVALAGVAAGVVLSMAVTAYGYAFHSWRFRIDSTDGVALSGVNNASRTQVMEVAGADVGRNIFHVPLDERKHQLEQIPWVETATVMRILPNRIFVQVRERVPVAFVQIGSRISLIDAQGVVMGMPANRQAKFSFPVIHGMTGSEPLSSRAAAMKLYSRMAQDLDSGADGARYMHQLSEVDLSDPEDVKVTASEGGATLLIHLGSSDFLPRYKLYLDHVVEWRNQYPNLQSVDLRYEGQVVVNPDAARPVAPPAPKLVAVSAPAPVKAETPRKPAAKKADAKKPEALKAEKKKAEAKKTEVKQAEAKKPVHRARHKKKKQAS